ncbi:MAG: hypothetical protein RLQ12_12345 [Cyclobacteriaceae bacterium]
MENLIRTFAIGAIAFTMVVCNSQKQQANNTDQRPAQQQGGRQQGPPSFAQLLTEMDADKDGKLARSEVKGPIANDFSTIDANRDGFLVESELANAPAPQRQGRR